MTAKKWSWTAIASLVGGAQWVWIPLVYAVYPWGVAGDRGYGHFDYALFLGPLLFTAALPGLFRHYARHVGQPLRVGLVVTVIGGVTLALSSFGHVYGHLLIGSDVPSPVILLPLLIMSAGFVILGTSVIRSGGRPSWQRLCPIAIAAVPLLWVATVLFVAIFLRSRMSEDAGSHFFDASFTALIVSFGSVWMLQGYALRGRIPRSLRK